MNSLKHGKLQSYSPALTFTIATNYLRVCECVCRANGGALIGK